MLHVRTVPVLISGSMSIRLDLTSTDRFKRMKGVFISGRYLFTDCYGIVFTVTFLRGMIRVSAMKAVRNFPIALFWL